MEQLGNKARLHQPVSLGSSNLVWLEKVSAFSRSVFIFNLPYASPSRHCPVFSTVCLRYFVPSIYQSYAKKIHVKTLTFSELPWHCNCLSPFATLENECLQKVITRTTHWYMGIWKQSRLWIRWNNWG